MPRKKSSERSTIKARIILALLGGKKSTTQISEELYSAKTHYDRFSKDINELEDQGIVKSRRPNKKTTPGPKGRIWYLNDDMDIETFKWVFELLPSEDALKFYSFPYAKKIINSALLREIERRWGIVGPFPSKAVIDKEQAEYNRWEEVQKLPATEKEIDVGGKKVRVTVRSGGIPMEPYWEYGRPEFFTEEDVLHILRLSPTALDKALRGLRDVPEVLLTDSPKYAFINMLLTSLILDFNTLYYPGWHLKAKIDVDLCSNNQRGELERSLHKTVSIDCYHHPLPKQVEVNMEAEEREIGAAGGNRVKENMGDKP